MPPAIPSATSNPPIEYAVAVWLGMPDDEIEAGLREGWIRKPPESLGTETATTLSATNLADRQEPVESVPDDARAFASRLESLLRRFDASLTPEAFAAAWEQAGIDDARRARRFVDFLAPYAGNDGDPETLESQLASLEAFADDYAGDARFVHLRGMTGAQLEELARSDGSVRRALADHSRFALTGDRHLERSVDPLGRFDRFDVNTGELRLTDAYLSDRARHLAWSSAIDGGGTADVNGDGWRFIDRATGDEATIELDGDDGRPMHQVIFARDDGDRVTGGATTDRIHGGIGDDILRGRAGDDLIEGGEGDDALQGGSGRDHLTGQQGGDELDGGAGADWLEGGGGADELAGGRGSDRLAGGDGDDVYRFESGDGADFVHDEGGALVIDDVVLSGTMRRDGERWTSADGHFAFALEAVDGREGATLVIRRADDSEGADAIRLVEWKPGGFGIELEEDVDPADANVAADGASASAPDASPLNLDGLGSIEGAETGDTGLLGAIDEASFGNEALHFDTTALVDAQGVAAALDAWSIPVPPDVGTVSNEAAGVTGADVAFAIADSGDAAVEDSASSLAIDNWANLRPPAWVDPSAVAPPLVALRHTP
ncbi:MAG TPA: calcium-binding protein [Casimicrobiaceae bacterium]|nr:calcium-binding protein [Casimicrobiaceae bacterium]